MRRHSFSVLKSTAVHVSVLFMLEASTHRHLDLGEKVAFTWDTREFNGLPPAGRMYALPSMFSL